ncbi:hypothetical protein MTP99_001559 [Tenebrio molitor]|jgi:hypothetical protein|nr:hypothetical protein MTP99_001557 [Tenebrio molitor]KAJ3638153.1 hypothetical protein MTP99_001559 [Tenebrio molitor]CAH1365272.1 unnamed protein product [Tenebrio molitor]
MNNSRKTLVLAQVLCREFSKTSVKNSETVTAKFQKLKESQKRFEIGDHTPVHLKGGLFDRLFYQATAVVTLVGVGLSLETFYKLTFK